MEKRPSGTRKNTLAQQGTLLLLILLASCATKPNPPPPPPSAPRVFALVTFRTPHTNTVHVAVNALYTNAESLFANDCGFTNVGPLSSISYGWNPVNDPQVVGYRFYWGTIAFQYDQSTLVGNVTNFTLFLTPPITNVYTVLCRGSNSMEQASSLTGPWTLVNTNRVDVTNPVGNSLYRGRGLTNWLHRP